MALQQAGIHLLFFLRFIQLGSVTVTGFIYGYLAWHHNNHYCAYYPSACTELQMSYVTVPWEYKFVLAACALAFTESYITNVSSLHRQLMPSYLHTSLSTLSPTILFGIATGVIFKNPSRTWICYFLQLPTSPLANVEEKNCAIVVDGYVTLCIALATTSLLFLLTSFITVLQTIRNRRSTPTTAPETKPETTAA